MTMMVSSLGTTTRTAMHRAALVAALVAPVLAPVVLHAQDWTWSGAVGRGNWVRTHNVNGGVSVEQGTGDRVQVTAIKKASRGGDTSLVRIEAKQAASGGDLVICAIWEGQGTCDEDGYHGGRHNGNWDNDDRRNVSVQFVVKLPAGVRLDARTVNGGIDIAGATSEVRANTVNGTIHAASTGGPVRAETVNGSIEVRMGTLGSGAEPLEFSTVNGSVRVHLPENANADVEISTVNGSLESDFPITMQGKMDRHHIRATLGKGGQRMSFSTVNGSVELLKS